MDPAKLPAVRAQIWTLIQAAKLDHDLGLDDRPHDAEFDEFILHVDGWLCEIKDAQIRDGLHVLGGRAGAAWPGSTWCWPCCAPARCGPGRRRRCRDCARRSGWTRPAGCAPSSTGSRSRPGRSSRPWRRGLGSGRRTGRRRGVAASPGAVATSATVEAVLRFAATEIVPRLARTTDEMTHVLHALDGGYVPGGAQRLAAARAW